jgi:hypothetical protein
MVTSRSSALLTPRIRAFGSLLHQTLEYVLAGGGNNQIIANTSVLDPIYRLKTLLSDTVSSDSMDDPSDAFADALCNSLESASQTPVSPADVEFATPIASPNVHKITVTNLDTKAVELLPPTDPVSVDTSLKRASNFVDQSPTVVRPVKHPKRQLAYPLPTDMAASGNPAPAPTEIQSLESLATLFQKGLSDLNGNCDRRHSEVLTAVSEQRARIDDRP